MISQDASFYDRSAKLGLYLSIRYTMIQRRLPDHVRRRVWVMLSRSKREIIHKIGFL